MDNLYDAQLSLKQPVFLAQWLGFHKTELGPAHLAPVQRGACCKVNAVRNVWRCGITASTGHKEQGLRGGPAPGNEIKQSLQMKSSPSEWEGGLSHRQAGGRERPGHPVPYPVGQGFESRSQPAHNEPLQDPRSQRSTEREKKKRGER